MANNGKISHAAGAERLASSTLTPLEAELLDAGISQDAEAIRAASERYDGEPPVFQWEIDPGDPELESGEADLLLAGWDYRLWWQFHPSGLVYASIQALREEPETRGQRAHPLGRNVAVNLVYDLARGGVVAVYGTARDFRPFIEVFRSGFIVPQRERAASEGGAK